MKGDREILAMIPARGGSKGVPRKNIASMRGKPLIAWTIEEALRSRYVDRLVLSSEDEEVIRTASGLGCDVPFVRPENLAQDDTPMIDVVLHVLDSVDGEYTHLVLLQPTSPLRTYEDIDACIELCLAGDARVCISLTESEKSPFWMYKISESGYLVPFMDTGKQYTRRQDMPRAFIPNGAVYVAETAFLRQYRTFIADETKAYVMPAERSFDIDNPLDMEICEFLLSKR
ncbi:MAG: acylneuraminate cytidylyltransferase family protein [Syntrophorhabdaceae bacterium]|nr:acylneuraminate cytidylyltransferase family protein [Syntrophorhabdaceae bacterium]